METPTSLLATCATAQSPSQCCVSLCSDGTYTQHQRQCPDGTSQVCFGVCVDESRQRNCLVMAVVNEENVTAHHFRAYSSSFNNEETTRLLQKNPQIIPKK